MISEKEEWFPEQVLIARPSVRSRYPPPLTFPPQPSHNTGLAPAGLPSKPHIPMNDGRAANHCRLARNVPVTMLSASAIVPLISESDSSVPLKTSIILIPS